MKSIFPVFLLLCSFPVFSYALDIEGLNKAIANPEIEITTRDNKERAQVKSGKTGYKITREVISKGDEFYLNRADYGDPVEARLSVAHKVEDGSYNYTTLHLHNGSVRRATECKKKMSRYWGLKNKYSCYYASEDVCKHLDTKLQKYMKTINECKEMFKDIKKILPNNSEVQDYTKYTIREMDRISAFSKNNGIERFPEFANFEGLDEVQNKGLVLFAEITENIHVCQKYYPKVMSGTTTSSSPASTGTTGTSGASKTAN